MPEQILLHKHEVKRQYAKRCYIPTRQARMAIINKCWVSTIGEQRVASGEVYVSTCEAQTYHSEELGSLDHPSPMYSWSLTSHLRVRGVMWFCLVYSRHTFMKVDITVSG